jgi:S1-C subfamily serine protease
VGDTSIASIDKYGKVKGITQGRTIVYATCNGKIFRSILAVYEKRISVTETVKTINQEDVLYVTVKNHKEKETLQCVVKDPTILDAKVGSFVGDKATINLTPKKIGTTTITLQRSNSVEELVVKITVIEKKELSAVEIYKKSSPAMVEIHVKTADGDEALGSGFFVDKNKILTNFHVIEGAISITAIDYNGNEYPAQYLYDYDKDFDLSLFGVNANHKSMEISYAPIVTGDRIFTIGSPYGLTGTLSTGLISKAYRQLDTDIIYTQITASISRGNSGGPLINRFGEVIGVNSLTRSEGQNLNFAVPITYLMDLSTSSPSKITDFYEQNQ